MVSFEDLNGDGLLARFLVDVEARTVFPFEAEPDPDATGSILASRRRGGSRVEGKERKRKLGFYTSLSTFRKLRHGYVELDGGRLPDQLT